MIDLKSHFRQCAIALVANKLYYDYSFVIKNFDGFEPEMYAEQWLRDFLVSGDHTFGDEVCRIFISMLQESGKKNG